jgi:hypothetical protein
LPCPSASLAPCPAFLPCLMPSCPITSCACHLLYVSPLVFCCTSSLCSFTPDAASVSPAFPSALGRRWRGQRSLPGDAELSVRPGGAFPRVAGESH